MAGRDDLRCSGGCRGNAKGHRRRPAFTTERRSLNSFEAALLLLHPLCRLGLNSLRKGLLLDKPADPATQLIQEPLSISPSGCCFSVPVNESASPHSGATRRFELRNLRE